MGWLPRTREGIVTGGVLGAAMLVPVLVEGLRPAFLGPRGSTVEIAAIALAVVGSWLVAMAVDRAVRAGGKVG